MPRQSGMRGKPGGPTTARRELSVQWPPFCGSFPTSGAISPRHRKSSWLKLEQQAATAEVLKVISGSTLELPAVLNIVVESACRLCEADIGTIRFEKGDRYRLAATFGCQPEWHKHFAGYSGKPDETSVFGQMIIKGRTGHIRDALKDRNYGRPQAQNLMGLRAALGVPLVRGAPGKFTEFRIVLPRAAASIAKTGERT